MRGESKGADIPPRDAERIRKRLEDDYADYLAALRIDPSPNAAHKFALAARHKGTTYHRSVADIVMQLAGAMPSYWSA